ncbi:acyltransferase family protein [Cronobacter dublinensis]|uniref:acyltransferase family protein n=1 Tax=Cronobacter dublinensis TaxID=413497 RepID=UPI0024AF5C06|nr:acyltransferase [Cronobacter dublinensis]MDI7491302.1 acyltransferase [Cronobacter dublinensis]
MILTLFLVLSLALAPVIVSSRYFSFLDNTQGSRNTSLDGLRYLMASLVVFHHSGFFASFFTVGKWTLPSEGLMYIGKIGVYVFFTISAFLFWGKTGASKKKVDWVSLYINRFFRIAPLQFFCSAVSIALILYFSKSPWVIHLKDIAPWFDAGLLNIRPDINNYQKSRVIMAGVTWTLQYEWFFYFSLPILFVIKKKAFPVAIVCLIVFLYAPVDSKTQYVFSLLSCFACGIICQEMYSRFRVTKKTAEFILLSSVILLVLVQPSIHNGKASLLCGLIVYAIVNGASFFNLLSSRGMVRLGEISYSIYLMQGIVFYTVFKLLDQSGIEINIFSVKYYLYTFVSFLLLIMGSVITFQFIEKPTIKLGHKLTAQMKFFSDKKDSRLL